MSEKQSEKSIFRILDAAINRAGEGVRVVEDYARMDLSDVHLASQLKQLRHDLTAAVAQIDPIERINARDSIGDVGRTIQTESEYVRETPDTLAEKTTAPSASMIQANLARAQQAFRTIEEFSKTISQDIAKAVEQLRYRAYTIEKAMLTTVFSIERIGDASLYVLIDACGATLDDSLRLQTLIGQLVDAEVDLIQLRDKSLMDQQLVWAAKLINQKLRGTQTRLIINDRADIALLSGAAGVHLGQDEISVSDARRILGANKLIGVSTHSIAQAREAVLDGANYIGVGPIFSSKTKSFDSLAGLEFAKQVANEIQLPAFAIGGIDRQNIGSVIETGIKRVAVSAAIVAAADPVQTASALKLATNLTNRHESD